MATKRTKYTDGLFVWEKLETSKHDSTPEEFSQAIKTAMFNASPPGRLERHESYLETIADAEWKSAYLDLVKEARRYADAQNWATTVHFLGRLDLLRQRVEIGKSEPDIRLGASRRQQQRNFAGKAADERTSQRQREWDAWQALADEIQGKRKNRITSKSELARQVAERLEECGLRVYPAETIRKRIRL